jgi:methionine-rich copper-binding protein CopC
VTCPTAPAADATVQTAPSEVAIEFTEGVEPKFSAIEVHDSQGMRVDNGDTHAALDNTKRLAVSLKPLQPGTYNVPPAKEWALRRLSATTLQRELQSSRDR